MTLVLRCLVRLRESCGQTMGEYAMVVGGIALIAYAAYQFLGTQISATTTSISGVF